MDILTRSDQVLARRYRNFSVAGAGLGLVLFAAVALLPSLFYGAHAGVLLATVLFRGPTAPGLGAQALVASSMALGVTAGAALFAALGAAAGSVLILATDDRTFRGHAKA